MTREADRLCAGGQLAELSPTEYRLLRCLLLNAGRVVSKAQILGPGLAVRLRR